MTDARNVYPRLCWSCLGVIEGYEHDHALMTYGGYCTDCHEHQRPYRPEVDVALRGQTERMNDVSEREELLREAHMSEEIDNQVEQMLLGESEQDTGELATGGVIADRPIMLGDGSPEIVFTPVHTNVALNAGTMPNGTYNVRFNADGTSEWNPIVAGATAATNMYVGDVPWQYWPPAIPSQYVPPVTITPTIGTSTEPLTPERIEELMRKQPIRVAPAPAPEITEERLRQIVAETIHKVLYPESGGLVTHQHRRVRMWDEQGDEWSGVLYKKEKESEM